MDVLCKNIHNLLLALRFPLGIAINGRAEACEILLSLRLRQLGQYRQFRLREVVHDFLRMPNVAPLIEITSYESLHVRGASGARVSAKNLQVHRRKVMVRIWIKLALEVGKRLGLDLSSSRVRIAELIADAIDPGVHGFK